MSAYPSRVADRYRPVRRLGGGRGGTVLLAQDDATGGSVALKVISDFALEDPRTPPERRELFLVQRTLVGRFAHPGLVAVHDAAATAQGVFLVMEYVAGGTLARYCRTPERLPEAAVVALAQRCVSGLAHACRLGVLHRDLKPDNILLDEAGAPRVSDFVPQVGAVACGAGTPAYFAPERHRGAPAGVATDIYALGVVLFELLCGRRPYVATSIAELARQAFAGPAPRASCWRDGIAPELDAVVARMLALEAEDRYASWEAVAAALAACAAQASGPQETPEEHRSDRGPGR